MSNKPLLLGMMGVGLLLFSAMLAVGIYLAFFRGNTQAITSDSTPRSETLTPKQNTLDSLKPSLKVNSDGSWTAVIPADAANGVTLESTDGKKLEIKQGDILTIEATGLADIGRGAFDPNGETTGYRDTSVDSPFSNHVGGLEMWIGSKNNRYFVGSHFDSSVKDSGVPTFRVIESLHGYTDGNVGGFTIIIRKKS